MKAAALLLIALSPTVAAAQSESFIVRLGADTIAVETFVRTANRLEGRLRGAALPVRLHYVYERDTLTIELTRAGHAPEPRTFAVPPGPVPFINLAFSFVELATARATRVVGDSTTVDFFIPDNGAVLPAKLHWISADSALLKLAGVDVQLRLDTRGRILHAAVPAQNVTVERVTDSIVNISR